MKIKTVGEWARRKQRRGLMYIRPHRVILSTDSSKLLQILFALNSIRYTQTIRHNLPKIRNLPYSRHRLKRGILMSSLK